MYYIAVGAAYVFVTADGGLTWSVTQKLVASDGADADWFGRRVSLSGDVAVVGADWDDDKGDNSGRSAGRCHF